MKKGTKHSEESKKKMSEIRFIRNIKPSCKPPLFTGKTHTLEVRKRISEAQKELTKLGKHNFFIDGKSKERLNERQIFMSTFEYKDWRKSVFERDNYTCQECLIRGCKGTGSIILEAHHVKSFKEFPELRLDVNNGLTLCQKCHKKQGRPKQKYND